ncbi:MAG TPA: hypothetical protein VJP77_03755 [Planctomycetota bacterium]|nr:hypothetical protein [Planctomycetota bacterium]
MRFVDADATRSLPPSGMIRISTFGGDRRELAVESCSVTRPSDLPADEPFYVLGIELGGAVYTYPDLDGTWDELSRASPVRICRGEPSPARVLSASGVELRDPLELGPPTSSGVLVDSHYRHVAEQLTSPIALPFIEPGHSLDLRAPDSWGRVEVLPRVSDASDADWVFREIRLRALCDVELAIHAETRLSETTLTLTPIPGLGAEGFAGSRSLPLNRSDWREIAGGWLREWPVPDLLAGKYRLSLLEAGRGLPLEIVPSELEVSEGSGPRSEFWISGPDPAAHVSAARLRLRFEQPVRELIARSAEPVSLILHGLDAGQLSAGQPATERHLLSTLVQDGADANLAQIEWHRGIAAGRYLAVLRPFGVVEEFEISLTAPAAEVAVPRVCQVEVRDTGSAPADGTSPGPIRPPFPLIEPSEAAGRPPNLLAVLPIVQDSGRRQFLLGEGEYRVTGLGAPAFVEPRTFQVEQDPQVVELVRHRGFTRELGWSRGGQRVGIPWAALRETQLLFDSGEVAEAIVMANEFDLASGKLRGLRLTTRQPGIYTVRYRLTLPGGDVVREVAGFEIFAADGEPMLDPIDELDE